MMGDWEKAFFKQFHHPREKRSEVN